MGCLGDVRLMRARMVNIGEVDLIGRVKGGLEETADDKDSTRMRQMHGTG